MEQRNRIDIRSLRHGKRSPLDQTSLIVLSISCDLHRAILTTESGEKPKCIFHKIQTALLLHRMRSILARLFCITPSVISTLPKTLTSSTTDLPSNSKRTRSEKRSDPQRFRFGIGGREMSQISVRDGREEGGEAEGWKEVYADVAGESVRFERFDKEILKSPNDTERQYRSVTPPSPIIFENHSLCSRWN